MKGDFEKYKFTSILLIAMLVGAFFGIFDATARTTSSQIEPEAQWYCEVTQIGVGESRCTARGCKRSNGQSDGYWVCDYVASGGASCPPLESCQVGSGN